MATELPPEVAQELAVFRRHRRILKWVTGGLLLGMAFVMQPYRVIYNHSQSAPLGFYLLHPKIERVHPLNEPVTYRYSAPDWALKYQSALPDGSRFMKRIGAIPGEYLVTEGVTVLACPAAVRDAHCRVLGVRKIKDPAGNEMPGTQFNMAKIPAGMYWLLSLDSGEPDAYDSRYLGLVPYFRITGQFSPLYTWPAPSRPVAK